MFTVGSTIAFFADTETSQDNVFVAGNLDVKVDSEAHFRDLVCVDGYWKDPEAVQCEDTSLIEKSISKENGIMSIFINPANAMVIDDKKNCEDYGFDYTIGKWEYKYGSYLPEGDPNGTVVFGNAKIADWTSEIFAAGIIRKAAWDYLVLPGGYSGVVSQYCPMGENNYCHDISHVEICGNYDVCGNCVLDDGEECDNSLNVTDGYYCTDDCKLKPLMPCTGSWEESDLIPGVHKFFEFSGLKPGDYGEDTISFHVYDNDAWGRFIIGNVLDNENGCQDGEYYDEPNCNIDEQGELGKKVFFNAWLDDGSVPGFQNTGLSSEDEGFDKEEGNNIKDEGELEIRLKNNIDIAGESWILAPILALRYSDMCGGYAVNGQNNGGVCQGLAEDGRLVSNTTYYAGLAWDFPLQNDNSTQSDTFMFDLSLEIEQWRNNKEPF